MNGGGGVWNTGGQGSLLDAFGKAERSGLGGRDKMQTFQHQIPERQAVLHQQVSSNHHSNPQLPIGGGGGHQQYNPYSLTPRGGGTPHSYGKMPPVAGGGYMLDQLEQQKRAGAGGRNGGPYLLGATPSLDSNHPISSGAGRFLGTSNGGPGFAGTNMFELQAETEWAHVPSSSTAAGVAEATSSRSHQPQHHQHHQYVQRQPPAIVGGGGGPATFDPNMFGNNSSAKGGGKDSVSTHTAGAGAGKHYVGTGVQVKGKNGAAFRGGQYKPRTAYSQHSPSDRDRSSSLAPSSGSSPQSVYVQAQPQHQQYPHHPATGRGSGGLSSPRLLNPSSMIHVPNPGGAGVVEVGDTPFAGGQSGNSDPYTPHKNELTGGPVVVDDGDRNAIEELFATDDFTDRFNAAAEARGQQVAREHQHHKDNHLPQNNNVGDFYGQRQLQQHQPQRHQQLQPVDHPPVHGQINSGPTPQRHQQLPQIPQPQYKNRGSSLAGLPQPPPAAAGGGGEYRPIQPPVCHVCQKQLPKDGDVAAYLSTPFDPNGPTPRRQKASDVPNHGIGAAPRQGAGRRY